MCNADDPDGPRWRVELRGARPDLQSLRHGLTDANATIELGDESALLYSPRFEPLDDAWEVHAAATDLVAELNGAAWIEYPDASPVTAGSVSERGEGRAWTTHATASAHGRSRMLGHAVAIVNGQRDPSHERPPRLDAVIGAAGTDDAVEELLHHLGTEPTWYGLYKAYEVIERNGGFGSSVSNKRRDLFRRTANYYHRHGDPPSQPPRKRMSVDEAKDLIRTLVVEWLEQRVPRGG